MCIYILNITKGIALFVVLQECKPWVRLFCLTEFKSPSWLFFFALHIKEEKEIKNKKGQVEGQKNLL